MTKSPIWLIPVILKVPNEEKEVPADDNYSLFFISYET